MTIILLFCFSFAYASAGSANDLGAVIVFIIVFLCSIVAAIYLAGLIKKKLKKLAFNHNDNNSTDAPDENSIPEADMDCETKTD